MTDRGNTRRLSFGRLIFGGVAVALVAAVGCRPAVHHPRVGGETDSRTQAARKQADSAALEAAQKVAETAAQVNPPPSPPSFWTRVRGTFQHHPTATVAVVSTSAPASPPSPSNKTIAPASDKLTGPTPDGPVIREKVSSEVPHPTVTEAEEDALQQARKTIAARLAALDPPVHHIPPLTAVKDHYLRKDSRVVRPLNDTEKETFQKAGVPVNQVYVEYTVEVTEDHLRQLRSQDRVVGALRALGGLLVLCTAGFLFLRADDWTRGYLTSWLGLLAGTFVVAGVVAVLTMG